MNLPKVEYKGEKVHCRFQDGTAMGVNKKAAIVRYRVGTCEVNIGIAANTYKAVVEELDVITKKLNIVADSSG